MSQYAAPRDFIVSPRLLTASFYAVSGPYPTRRPYSHDMAPLKAVRRPESCRWHPNCGGCRWWLRWKVQTSPHQPRQLLISRYLTTFPTNTLFHYIYKIKGHTYNTNNTRLYYILPELVNFSGVYKGVHLDPGKLGYINGGAMQAHKQRPGEGGREGQGRNGRVERRREDGREGEKAVVRNPQYESDVFVIFFYLATFPAKTLSSKPTPYRM